MATLALTSSTSYHMSPLTGKPERCSASTRGCPYGGAIHGSSEQEVYELYAQEQGGSFTGKQLTKARELALLVHGDSEPTPLEVNYEDAQRKLLQRELQFKTYNANFRNYLAYAVDPNSKISNALTAVRAKFSAAASAPGAHQLVSAMKSVSDATKRASLKALSAAEALQDRLLRTKSLKIPTPHELRRGIRLAQRRAARIALLCSMQRHAVAILSVPDTTRHAVSAVANSVATALSAAALTPSLGATAAKTGLAGYHTAMAIRGVHKHHREGLQIASKILEQGHDPQHHKRVRDSWGAYLKANKTNIAFEAASLMPLGYWAKDISHGFEASKELGHALKEGGTWLQVALGTFSSLDEWRQHKKRHRESH